MKVTHSDGDVFYAGITTDTDKLNGIATQINANTAQVAIDAIQDQNAFLVASNYWMQQYQDDVLTGMGTQKTNFKTKINGCGFDFETLEASAQYDLAGSTTLYWDDNIVVCDILDLFDDDTMDATIWTKAQPAGTDVDVTESGTTIVIGGSSDNGTDSAYLRSDGSTGFNCKTANCTVIMAITSSVNEEVGTYAREIRITDGTNTVAVITGADTDADFLEMYFDVSAKTVNWRTGPFEAWDGAVDISSVTGAWYLEFFVSLIYGGFNTLGANITISKIGYVQSSAATGIFYSNKEDTDTNKTAQTTSKAMMVLGYFDELSTATVQNAISANNGGAYTNVEQGVWTSGLTAGADVIAKATVTTNATKPVYITEYFVAWEDD